MVDATEDQLLEFLRKIEALKAEVRIVMTPEMAKKFLQRKIKAAAEVKRVSLLKFDQVMQSVKGIRDDIARSIASPGVIEGCLMGEVDDYVQKLEPERVRMETAFEKNEDHLQK